MRVTNKWLGAACASLFFLGAVGCRTTHKDGARAEKKKAVLPTAVGPTQTGSSLPRHAYVTEETKLADERREQAKKEKKAKSKSVEKIKKSEKRKPVDQDYVPRGGFR